MNISIAEINNTRKSVVVTISTQELKNFEAEILQSFAQQAKIAGFRPGKAPMHLIKQRYKSAIEDELHSKAISKAYDYLKSDGNIAIYGIAEITGDAKTAEEEATLVFMVDLQPEFELPEYTNIPVSVEMPHVQDQEINDVINTMLNQRAQYNKVERPAQKGDYVRLSYEGKLQDGTLLSDIIANKPIYTKQSVTWEEAGSQDSPGVRAIVDGIIGMQAGEEKEVTQDFPSNFEEPLLANKSALYSIKVEEVREKVLPPMNEELLKSFQVASEEDLRERIKTELKNRKEQTTNTSKRQQIIDHLNEKTQIEIPQLAKDHETNSILKDFVESQVQRGVSQKELEQHKTNLISQAEAAAGDRAKSTFILSKIAEHEKIEVTQDDLSRIIYMEAMMARTKPDQFVKELKKDQARIERMRENALFNKTLDFLVEKANVTYVDSDVNQ